MKKEDQKAAKRLKSYKFFLIFFPLAVLGGCYHRGPVDVWTDLVHKMRGGSGSGLMPPAPGTHGAYPFVGDVPKENPEFPSRPAQAAMTAKLEADRNMGQRHAAETGILAWPKLSPPPPLSDLAGNMIMADNDNPPSQSEKQSEEPLPDEALEGNEEKDGSELIDHHGLPKVIYHPNSHADIPVSRLPVVPPPPIDTVYPGFPIPKGGKMVRPDMNYADPEGTLIHFKPLTDEISDREDGHFREIIAKSKAGNFRFIVKGFGNALSSEAGLSPADQSREIAFGLLRAQAAANRLIEMGINPRDISVYGEAIGDGARISLEAKKNVETKKK